MNRIIRKIKRMLGIKDAPKKSGSGKLPKEIKRLAEKEGLLTDNFKFAAKGDMNPKGVYCSAWTAVDEKGIYVITADEKVARKHGNRRLEAQYELKDIICIPIDDIEQLKTEQYVSTGRLIAVESGDDVSVVKFSIGLLSEFDKLCDAFELIKSGKPLPDEYKSADIETVCPKCGKPYSANSKVCTNCIGSKSTVRRLIEFFGGYKSKVVLIIFAILINSGVAMVVPQISTQALFDNILNKVGTEDSAVLISALGTLVLSMVMIKIVELITTIAFQYMMGSIMPRVIYDIKVKIFAAMQRLSVSFYSSKQTGSLMERVTRDSNNVYWFFVDGMPYVITNLITVAGVLIIMFVKSWKLALMTLTAVPVFLVILVLSSRLFKNLHHRSWVSKSRLTSMVSDNINGQRIIKAFSKEDEELDRFEKVNDDVYKADLKLNRTSVTFYPIVTVLLSLLATFILTLGGLMVYSGEISVGTLLSFTVYLGMLVGPVDFLSWVSNWWARCVDSAQRIFEIVDAKADVIESETPVKMGEIKGDIEISELEFEYEPAHPIIKKLSLSAEAGQMLGIVGKTGAGKTTIANLIARLYDPKRGTIKIDGIDVKDMRISDIRKNVGLVSQDIYLFMGTIADNIRYAKPDATMEEVIAAAKSASAHDFIMKLPDAYETRVGVGGQGLSGGERQRISIARTIIQNPRILILDEATAAMDTETERNIQYSLNTLMQGRTTIAIAHRLSTLRDADMLAVIDDGVVTEHGTYAELLKKHGEFYKLYKIQSEALKAVGIAE